MISVKNLSKTINGKKILKNLNFELSGITGIIGPNGAGKTTLMKILASVEKGDRDSEIMFNNKQSSNVSIGYLPQHFSIYPNLTVFEALKLISILKKDNDSSIVNLLELLNLNDYHDVKMKNLSGGTLKRVGIVQALFNNPKYLIIDEPTAGLDILESIKLRNTLFELSKDINIIISSHIPEDIRNICNNVIVLDKGKIKYNGSLTKMIQYSEALSYEAIVEINQIKKISNMWEITKIDKITSNLAKVVFISDESLSNNGLYKRIKPGFLESYISLLQKK